MESVDISQSFSGGNSSDGSIYPFWSSSEALESSINGTTEEPPWVFDDIHQRIVVAALLFVIAVFGLTGNILTIIAVILSRKLQTIANVFVVNLTVAGGLSCATLPFTITNMIANTETGIIPRGLCSFVSLMSYFSFSGTIVSHALIAFDRYYRITKSHYKYHKMFTKCRITMLIICAWLYANISVVLAIATHVNVSYNEKYRVCLPDIVDPDVVRVSIFRATTIDLFILILVLACYTAIFIYIYRHNRKLLGMFNVRSIRKSFQKRFGSKTSSREPTEPEPVPRSKHVSDTALPSKHVSDTAPIVLISMGPLSGVSNCNPSSDRANGNSVQIPNERDGRNDWQSSNLSVERSSSSQTSPVREPSYRVRFAGTYNVAKAEQWRSSDTLSAPNSPVTNGRRRNPEQNYVDDLSSDVSSLSGLQDDESSIGNGATGKECDKPKRRVPDKKISSLSQEGVNLRTTLNARQVKITMNMFLVVSVYVICIAPYIVCLIVNSLEIIFPYVAVVYAFSNAINPAIYAWKHPYFRAVFKPMIQLKFSKIPNPSPFLKFFTVSKTRRNTQC